MFNWTMFPFTKMNAINLDWLMKKFQELVDKTGEVDQAVLDAQAAAEAAEQAAQTITGAVLYDRVQTLTSPEQAQARDNIGAADAADTAGVLRYTEQTLTSAQQAQARDNIGAADAADVVSDPVQYDTAQTLTAAQKAQARDNIGAADAADVVSDPVQYNTAQTLTAVQQAQARDNIGAAADGAVAPAVAHAISSISTVDGWRVIKYADGRVEADKIDTINTDITDANGNNFTCSPVILSDLPTGIFDTNETIYRQFSMTTESNAIAWLVVYSTTGNSAGTARLIRSTAYATSKAYYIHIHLDGTQL